MNIARECGDLTLGHLRVRAREALRQPALPLRRRDPVSVHPQHGRGERIGIRALQLLVGGQGSLGG